MKKVHSKFIIVYYNQKIKKEESIMEENEVKTEETNNDIQIAEDVICVVSGVAIKEIEGVAKVATDRKSVV